MNAKDYVQELATLLGLQYVEGAKPFDHDPIITVTYQAGSVLGARAGFPIALSLVKQGNSSQLAILIRYKAETEDPLLIANAKQAFEASKMLGSRSVKGKPGRLVLTWGYTLKKPEKEEVVRLLDAVIAAIGVSVQSFSGKCETCGGSVGNAMVLMNDVPSYVCSTCQQQMIEQRRLEAEAYAARDVQFVKAFVASTVVAAVMAFAIAWFYFWIDKDGTLPIKVLFLFPIFIGLPAGWVFAKTVGRIAFKAQAVPLLLLGFVGSYAAFAGYCALYIARLWTVPMSFSIFRVAAESCVRLNLHGENLWSLAGHIVSAIACVGIVKGLEPKFDVKFVPLAQAAMSQAAGQK